MTEEEPTSGLVMPAKLIVPVSGDGEVFRVNQDGSIVGDIALGIAACEASCGGSRYLGFLRAIKRLQSEVADLRQQLAENDKAAGQAVPTVNG